MTIDLQSIEKRSRQAYERGRHARAACFSALLAALGLFSLFFGTRPTLTVVISGALACVAWLCFWQGKHFEKAVIPGVLAGLIPLSLALLARSYGHVCTGSECVSLCLPACSVGGVAAGMLVTRHAKRSSKGITAAAISGSLALLIGSLGCSCAGYSGVLGMLLGLLIAPAFQGAALLLTRNSSNQSPSSM